MAKRFKLPGGISRRLFTKAGSRTHRLNIASGPMRGGIRL